MLKYVKRDKEGGVKMLRTTRQEWNMVMCCRMLNSRAVNMAGALDREIAPQNVNGR